MSNNALYKPMIHSGVLADDAPGLTANLKNILTNDGLTSLQELYQLRHSTLGDFEESNLKRTAGANFTPFFARLASIMLKELSESRLIVYQSCFIFGTTCSQKKYKAAQTISIEANDYLEAKSKSTEYSEEAERLALVVLLDRCRHLHMSKSNLNTQKEFYQQLILEFLPKQKYKSNQRINEMIEHWTVIVKSRYNT